jgi:histone acetyltransferase MYST1
MRECTPLHPPGNEVYRGEKVSVFEVDGALSVVYCQCLCLLAKLFLEHKTLYFDVQLFNFYVLCEHDSEGYHIAGFFSKEKNSPIDIDYNVACILTFPQFQKRGYGRFLIELSYELSRREGRPGTPERPLSDLGWISYRSFWIEALLGVLKRNGSHVSIKQISELTGIKSDDVISTLQDLGLVRYMRGEYVVVATPKLVEQCMATFTKKPGAGDRVQFDPTLLAWDARLAQQRPRYGAKRRRLSAPAVAAAEPSTQP